MGAKHKKQRGGSELLIEQSGQLRITEKSAEQQALEERRVECLGMVFESDEARRAYFLEKLRERLKDPEFRKIEGFPIGSDEDILALSDPPFYTASPNPFIEDFIHCYGKLYDPSVPYNKQPFSADVSEGRHEPVYLAHTYHAKVPYRAVLRYVLAYTEPGDIVFDGFAGTGMVGVACQQATNPPEDIRKEVVKTIESAEFGPRIAVLSDLSPVASLIASVYNLPGTPETFAKSAREVLAEVYHQYGWLYETMDDEGTTGQVKYYVWSDVFACPHCAGNLLFATHVYRPTEKTFVDTFDCPGCAAHLSKDTLERVFETVYDPLIGRSIKRVKQSLYLTSFATPTGKRVHRSPSMYDIELVGRVDELPVPNAAPCHELPYMHMTHERNKLPAIGVTHIHHFFTRRNLLTLTSLMTSIFKRPQPIRRTLLFWVNSCLGSCQQK